ncbi:AAA family ATPase [Nocardia vinacea]|uniref:AAA family ATPase n=1 Tax=Nocardia vinacea TaxID=96468 RepID=UPI0002F34822|nr:AAA family ATPase [Nocardia vinacea]
MTVRVRNPLLSLVAIDYSETMVAAWPLIGRAEELDRLRESTAPAARGLVLVGSAGVGKTRLAGEILSCWRGQGRRCRWFVATRSARSVPLGVFAEVAETGDGDSLRRIRSVVAALTDGGGGGRVLLVIDDAHLLDEQSALVLHQIVRHERADVLLTMRSGEPSPDAVSGLWKDQLLARLDLQPLSQLETTDLLNRVLGGQVESSAAVGLWRFTRGNVLHLRHLVDGERADGRLTEREGVWVWEGRPEISAPLAELIDTGIARQPAPVLAVVDMLSVADPLEVEVLTALCDPDAVQLAHRAGLITVDTSGAPALVRLAHPLLGEVHRARSLPARLQALRSKVARELELQDNSRGPITLVRRAVLICESDLAPDSDLLIEAARAALRLSDPVTAERLARRAVEAGGGRRAHRVHVGGLVDAQRFREAYEVAVMLTESASSPRERVLMAIFSAVVKATMVYNAALTFSAAAQTKPVLAVEAAQAALNSAELFNDGYELFAVIGLTAGNAMLGHYSAMAASAERGYVMGRNSQHTATTALLHGFYHLGGSAPAAISPKLPSWSNDSPTNPWSSPSPILTGRSSTDLSQQPGEIWPRLSNGAEKRER